MLAVFFVGVIITTRVARIPKIIFKHDVLFYGI